MNLDTRTSKIRMKKISEYSRFCEWEPEIYMNNFITIMETDFIPSPLEMTDAPSHFKETIINFLSTNPIVQGVIQSVSRMC